MSGRVIVITSGKGGVGKTTTNANIGTALARAGKKVVMIDTDLGLRNLDLLLGLENRIVYTIVDVVEERCKLKQALVKDKKNPNLCLLAAAQTRDKSAVTEEQLKDICEKLKKDFDFILVDCPAGIEQGFQNAVAGASEAIVVTTPEMSAVRDADRIIGLLEAKEEIKSYKLLLNRVRPNLIKSNDMMSVDDVVEILSADLIGIIPEDTGIITSTNKGEPIVNDEKSLAGKAYNNVARRIIGEDVPFLNLEEPQGVMAKIKKFRMILANLYNKVLGFFRQTEKEAEESSKDTARNRLRVVLMQDRTNLTPELMERMRKELVELLSKYVEMDKEALELNLEQDGDQVALMLSIPVIRAKDEEEIKEALEAEDVKKEASEEESDEESEDETEEEENLDDDEDLDENSEVEEESEEDAEASDEVKDTDKKE